MSMLEIHTTRQAYQAQEISNIGFVQSANNIADRLPKSKKQSALIQVLLTGRDTINWKQWIFREDSTEKKH